MDNFTQEMKLTIQKNSSSVIKELPSLLDVSFEQPALLGSNQCVAVFPEQFRNFVLPPTPWGFTMSLLVLEQGRPPQDMCLLVTWICQIQPSFLISPAFQSVPSIR